MSTQLQPVEAAVNIFYPGLLPAVDCGLAVFGAMALKGRTKPLVVVFETPSGYGKSAVVQMFFPIGESGAFGSSLHPLALRVDDFTPKSFVSHAANISTERLKAVDLLPKLRGKVLLTKELSPIFRGREEDIKDKFKVLIPVLDGKGLMTQSGTKGLRGYAHDILFNWLGATTPVPPETHRLMNQLGTRLLFYESSIAVPTEEDLLTYTMRDDAGRAEDECRRVINAFLVELFNRYPVGSVPSESIAISEEMGRELTRWALLVGYGRAAIKRERTDSEWEAVGAGHPEGPWKLINYFKDLARGRALVHGRTEVDSSDLELLAQVAVSSIPGYLRPIVRRLRTHGAITSTELGHLGRVTRPTARRHLLEMSLLGIGELTKGDPSTSTPDTLTVSAQFRWLSPATPDPCKPSVGQSRERGEIRGLAKHTQGTPDFQGGSAKPGRPR